ncbi:hypothetical protein Nepgr_025269 [Nepenthes gracilis]|uniref:Uncharacterized protein n=1 Tax=Nepenthes gracilis TaxID=150966 RepID=A0AAD3T6C7_NEPGR|nr:hypothetical protein Nepgr_025269 [Nepenthes gracilis]
MPELSSMKEEEENEAEFTSPSPQTLVAVNPSPPLTLIVLFIRACCAVGRLSALCTVRECSVRRCCRLPLLERKPLLLSPLFLVAVAINHLKPVFNFGDSNSDTGNLVTAGIEGLGPPNGQTYFQKPSGSVIFAVDAMDMPFLNAYLDSIAAPIFKKGSNFAAAGSTILPAAATSVSPFSFGIQVLQFVQFKSRALYLLSKEIV